MYDKAERRSFFTSDSNPGPGTYNLPSSRDYREENVPFRIKVGHLSIWRNTQGPAPNSYSIKYRKHRIRGAAWSRMTEKKPFAQYNKKSEDDDIATEQIHRTNDETKNSYFWVPNLETPRVWKGRPTKYLEKCKNQIKGTSTVKNLNLRKYYVRTYEDVQNKCSDCEKYRGPSWSKYRGARLSNKPLNMNPSPAEYDIGGDQPTEENEWFDAVRFYKRATTKLERYTEKIECKEAYNDEPSPAETVFSPDIGKPKSFNVKGTFGNPKKHISTIDKGGPSPMDYNPHQSPSPITNKKKPPFNTTTERQEKIVDLPGPASYNPPQGSIQFKLCKKLPPNSATFAAPFNTTGVQRPSMVDKGIPDPTTYDLSVKPRKIPYGVKTTTFTLRGDSTKTKTKPTLSPAHYDMITAYERLKRRCDRTVKRKPFNSTGPRFPMISSDIDIPGPGSYHVKYDALRSEASAAMKMRPPFNDKKNRYATSDTPGPGSYEVHPLYNDSLVKAHCSHNVTLVPYSNVYPIKPFYGPPLPKTILKTFVKGG